MEMKCNKKSPVYTIESGCNSGVKNVCYSSKAVYFCNEEGVYCRLTFEGINGWRLQTSRNGSFDKLGASQAIKQYMGEDVRNCTKKISTIQEGKKLVIREKGGTYAVLALDDIFSLQFCSKEGKAIIEVTYIGCKNESILMCGSLAEQEAIYGGGERLDTANKRGTAFDLYTCDGWNDSNTTYVVVPLFLTTRGGGMFVNRNESAFADFGKSNADTWSYLLRYGNMDCYFYPFGKMEDVLKGYISLSGYASLPTPWMHGVHICRYGPDFTSFDNDKAFESLNDIPNQENLYLLTENGYVPILSVGIAEREKADILYYNRDGMEESNNRAYVKTDEGFYTERGWKGNPGGLSCKTIMEKLIRADMKPDSAILEARWWERCFFDTDESRANKEDLQKSINWLHDHGMKALVYIRVGGAFPEMIGFKEEYFVHANVEICHTDGTIEVRENTTDIPWLLGTGVNPDGSVTTQTYLDITNEEAIRWYFGEIWGEMIRMGIDGVKIDFCECMPDGDIQCGITKTHYNWKKPGLLTAGTEHHAYAPYFISRFYKMMNDLKKECGRGDGFMVFVRGGGIGSQRNPYMWSGDQVRSYEKLDDQILAVVNSGLSGVPFMSYDMAGYAYGSDSYYSIGRENESEIFARAVEFSAFMTQIQTHGDVRHAYEMTEETQEIYRNFTRLHKDLIPYIQKYSKIACESGIPPIRHLVLSYPNDKNVYDIIDEFMLGDGILVAPIITKNTYKRSVYLPEGTWTELLTGKILSGGEFVEASANIGQIPVYLNNNAPDANVLNTIFEGTNWFVIKNWR